MNFFTSKFSSRGSMKQIGGALERIADCLEHICREQFSYNVRAPKADKSGDAPETFYTDETLDYLRELKEEYERSQGKVPVGSEED